MYWSRLQREETVVLFDVPLNAEDASTHSKRHRANRIPVFVPRRRTPSHGEPKTHPNPKTHPCPSRKTHPCPSPREGFTMAEIFAFHLSALPPFGRVGVGFRGGFS